jgi:fermentation-respiration switch protein FrsA (DUF1100 family)
MPTIDVPTTATVEAVAFRSAGATLAGNLFTPAHSTMGTRLPAVVVTGTWTSIKEQMADRYAAGLAARGITALSFDFAGFGASGGEPREVESARRKACDILHAAQFLAAQPGVDADRIGGLAICASAMYAVRALTEGAPLRTVALVAPWIHDAVLVRDVYGGEDGVQDKLAAGERAAERYASTGVVEYVPAADADDPRAAMPMAIDFYTSPARGGMPGWPNRFAVMAWPEWLRLDAIAMAPQISVPTIVIHSADAAIPDGAKRFYEGLRGPKEIVWSAGTQSDFYDQEPTVGHALDRTASYFGGHLGRLENGGIQ